MLLEGIGNAMLRWLRIPPGTSLRHAGEVSTSSSVDLLDNPYVNTIVGITVDDICIGETPLSVECSDATPDEIKQKLEEINDEFNTIVKDVAWDLCTLGFSVYDSAISDKNKLVLLPHLDVVRFYLTRDKKVVAVDENDEVLNDSIIFINYNRRGLVKIDKEDVMSGTYAFSIAPEPMQLKNADSAITSLMAAENNLDRFRAMISRPIRLVNVDIGASQGDQQKDVVDTIASAINANSTGLTSVVGTHDFDDNIPVLPNRNGKGKAEVYDSVPDYNLDELADIDHYMGKLSLVTRFPSSYMDFTKNIDETAVSLLRGDIRYYKMCNKVRTKIVDTLNDFVRASGKFREYLPCFILTQLPNSEDEDVMSALDNYIDIATSAESFVIGEAGDVPKNVSIHRLQMLQDLFASSTTSPMLQKWFANYRDFLETRDEVPAGEDLEGGDFGPEGGLDEGGSDDFGGGPESDFDLESPEGEGPESNQMEFVNEGGNGPADVEFVDEKLTM